MESPFYVANSATEVLLNGFGLVNGNRVLIAELIFKGSEIHENSSEHEIAKAETTLQWCEVTNIRVSHDIVSFVGKYDDGTIRPRTYNGSVYWIVKLDSMPKEYHEYQVTVNRKAEIDPKDGAAIMRKMAKGVSNG